ncbi:hypothetical protein B296_00026430 [Ensete ventricosum]|uniref:Uncharacterized protein n=1 Tax=Ensete ventricosum TaxID=4639 RepID=A0A426YT26_ENSVE|nr:hypothetical protein B296_00026430 [Ensete ventricosum]
MEVHLNFFLVSFLLHRQTHHYRLPLQVVRLRGILSSSMAIKSITEAWLEVLGLSLTPEGMNIMGMKKAIAARPPLKRLKKVGDSIILTKEASPVLAPRPRVIDNLSRLNGELQADVQKLKDESKPIVVVAIKARANETTAKLGEVQRREA